jgi:hypothetical protein
MSRSDVLICSNSFYPGRRPVSRVGRRVSSSEMGPANAKRTNMSPNLASDLPATGNRQQITQYRPLPSVALWKHRCRKIVSLVVRRCECGKLQGRYGHSRVRISYLSYMLQTNRLGFDFLFVRCPSAFGLPDDASRRDSAPNEAQLASTSIGPPVQSTYHRTEYTTLGQLALMGSVDLDSRTSNTKPPPW